ncbi:MAG: MBL fold metallo-hydrolase [Clostridia bacterium]|nr:MBL fold metallo-hydrolase [Clostridia bacterium]
MAKLKEYVIVISKNATYNERRAAKFLSDTIKKVGGRRPTLIYDDTEPTAYEIVIGRTEREVQLGAEFTRAVERAKEFEVRCVSSRLFVTGLGLIPEPAEFNPDASMNYGDIGTVFAVYYLVEKVMGHKFVYKTVLDMYSGSVDVEIDEKCNFIYNREMLLAQMPEKIDGTAMYYFNSVAPSTGGQGIIFKTREGKLVVIDGGLPVNTESFLKYLELLWDGEGVPVVSAWFFSHMHIDHFGVYHKICTTPEYRARLKVEGFYCDLLDDEFYAVKTSEPLQYHVEVRHVMMSEYEDLGVKVHTVKTGEHIVIDELDFEVIHTPSDVVNNPRKVNPNDSTVVYKLNVDNKQTIMFLGDAEGVCSDQMLEFHKDKLKSDVVQAGHHGVANVSGECYNAIDAKVFLYSSCLHTWYLEWGMEIHGAHDPGMKRQHYYMTRLGVKDENVYTNNHGMLTFKLPIEIK